MKRRTRFVTWAKRDPEDTKAMKITFKSTDGVIKLNSGQPISYSMMERIREAWIESVELVDNEWIIIIYEE